MSSHRTSQSIISCLRFVFEGEVGLGLRLELCDVNKSSAGWVAETVPRPIFLIGAPIDGDLRASGNGQAVAPLTPRWRRLEETMQ